MSIFPRWHTPESVAKQLIDGLESGALTLDPPALSTEDMIAEALRLCAAIDAALIRRDPEYKPSPLPTPEGLAAREKERPGIVLYALEKWQEIDATLKSLQADEAALNRKRTVLRWTTFGVVALNLVWFTYLCLTASYSQLITYLLGLSVGFVLSAPLWRLYFQIRKTNAEHSAVLSDLAQKARVVAELRTV
jgi:hypothetical protein